MLFTSFPFVLFFAVFFLLYWFVFNNSLKLQNLLLLAGSYFFYAWWDWHFLFLLAGYSLFNYLLGYYIHQSSSQKTKNRLLYTGVAAGIGSLIYFKYTNFFINSLLAGFAKLGVNLDIHSVNILLPLGISFYTFRTLTYIFDINKGKLTPAADWVTFFSFVAFFPCLFAGPIDKAKTLIPQLEIKRIFNYSNAVDATRQILWGLFKKSVVANSLAVFTDDVFGHYHSYSGSTLVIATLNYSIQLYADFSGYSDMAIGLARLLGFEVTKNFDFPFFSQNIAEFWRKWHMSLTKWFTEYLFTPLSIRFRDYGKAGLTLAVLINLTVIGAWHGANWTFIVFGLLHGCYFIPLIIKGTMNKNKKAIAGKLPSFTEIKNMLLTFLMVSFSFIVFRSDTLTDAFNFMKKIFSGSILQKPQTFSGLYLFFILVMLVIEWTGKSNQYAIEKLGSAWPRPVRWAFYYSIFLSIFFFSELNQNFIYFQF